VKISLARYIHEYFEVEYGSKMFNFIYLNCVKYLTKTISASEFHKRMKRVSDESIKVFRLGLVEKGYFIFNVKMYLIRACSLKRMKVWNNEAEMKAAGIFKRDREYLPGVLYDVELCNQVKAITFQLGGRDKIPTTAELQLLCAEIVIQAEKRLKPLISNLIWTKLKFLIQCGSIDMESVRCEIKAKMIQTFYWLTPFKKLSLDHWVMTMIQPIKNHMSNLLYFHTTQKRKRLYEEQGVYKSIEVSMQTLEDESKSTMFSDESKTGDQLEIRMSVRQLVRKHGVTRQRLAAMRLMCGVFDEKFTLWLKDNNYIASCSNMDNTDFQEQSPTYLFLKLVSRFVQIKWEYFKKFIIRMREDLVGEKQTEFWTETEGLSYGIL